MKLFIKIIFGVLLASIFVIATDFQFLWLPIAHSSEYPTKIAALFVAVSVLVTLLLALTTVNSTEQSKLSEINRRTDEINKENRDRRERWINEIIAWVEDIQSVTHDTEPAVFALRGKDLVARLLNTCNKQLIKAKSIEAIANNLDEDLETSIHDTSSKLNICRDACRTFLMCEEGPKLKEASDLFIDTSLATVESTKTILEHTSRIKISLLV